jgi:light-regulated signal transduction histidine kinase (bacteriophytochrome)
VNIETKYKEILDQFKKDTEKLVKDAVIKIYTDMLPHIEDDTEMNVQHRSEDIIKNLLAGNVEFYKENTVKVKDTNGVGVYLTITDNRYDNIRKKLLEVMPTCPKDLEIQSLKERLKRAYERNY